jgi:hypothetical protein|nr:MAG TPA: hypothetical protein [Caudoviricetes sp.]
MGNLTLIEYIRTLPNSELIEAYMGSLAIGQMRDKEIIDMYEQHARERLIIDYPIHGNEDVLRFFDDIFPDWENNPDLVEERKEWEEYSWYKLRQTLDATYGNNWHEYKSYYFVDNVR